MNTFSRRHVIMGVIITLAFAIWGVRRHGVGREGLDEGALQRPGGGETHPAAIRKGVPPALHSFQSERLKGAAEMAPFSLSPVELRSIAPLAMPGRGASEPAPVRSQGNFPMDGPTPGVPHRPDGDAPADIRSLRPGALATALSAEPVPADAGSAIPPPGDGPASTAITARLPLVLEEVLPGSLTLTDPEWSGIARLQDSFVDAVGGENQDPRDPGYRARWLSQVPLHDQLLRAQLGTAGFVSYQIQAAQARHQRDGNGGW